MRIGDIDIKWLGHAGFLIKNSLRIYIDPYNISENNEKADLILITHSHYDHCSLEDLNKIVQEKTRIICPPDCQSKIAKLSIPVKIDLIEPGQEIDIGTAEGTIKVSAVPAYNTDKEFHPKESHWAGYIVKIKNTLIYHAGDTDKIPEMQKLTGFQVKDFIALLPVGGRFTMDAEEASEAAALIKPSLAIPMHYGSIIGSGEDAREFVEFCRENNIKAEILKKE